MAVYEVSGRSTLVTATVAAALASIRAVTRKVYVREIAIFYVTAPTTSGGLGLCKSTALGTGALTSVTPVARELSQDNPTALLVTAWATVAPTNGGIGTVFRRLHAGPAIGNGVIWTFDGDELEIVGGAAATSELCIVNTIGTAPGTFDISVVYEE